VRGLRRTGEDVSMTVPAVQFMQVGMAAPLVGFRRPRYHRLDLYGVPFCMPVDRPPVHAIDYENMMGMEFIAEASRCHRGGCAERWSRGAG
jgi:hypothetical protein